MMAMHCLDCVGSVNTTCRVLQFSVASSMDSIRGTIGPCLATWALEGNASSRLYNNRTSLLPLAGAGVQWNAHVKMSSKVVPWHSRHAGHNLSQIFHWDAGRIAEHSIGFGIL